MSRNVLIGNNFLGHPVTPRERRVSRNNGKRHPVLGNNVTPRERRVSRNSASGSAHPSYSVTPRERRVSRNCVFDRPRPIPDGHASREACE